MIIGPLVSVLMTAYNRERYIEEAIVSVLNSTYVNFELIIVDDQSTDSTIEIVRKLKSTDNRIQLYINDKNLGDYPNRNKAASYAKGEFIKYLDSDDIMYEDGLELMVKYMVRYPQVGMGFFLPQDKIFPYPKEFTPIESYHRHFFGTSGFLAVAPCAVIMRSNIFNLVGGFSDKRMVGDLEMWLKIAEASNVLLMPGIYTWYREHDSQEINAYYNFLGDYCKVSLEAVSHTSLFNSTEKKHLKSKITKAFAKTIFLSYLLKRRQLTIVRINIKSMNWDLVRLFKEFIF